MLDDLMDCLDRVNSWPRALSFIVFLLFLGFAVFCVTNCAVQERRAEAERDAKIKVEEIRLKAGVQLKVESQ